jgi:hypothetical protein
MSQAATSTATSPPKRRRFPFLGTVFSLAIVCGSEFQICSLRPYRWRRCWRALCRVREPAGSGQDAAAGRRASSLRGLCVSNEHCGLMQLTQGTVGTIRTIAAEEGVRGLYSGLAPNVLALVPNWWVVVR